MGRRGADAVLHRLRKTAEVLAAVSAITATFVAKQAVVYCNSERFRLFF